MYPKAQASHLRKQFFTSFGQYMAPVPSADGERINWLNYRTGIKYIQLRMETPDRDCEIGLVLSHPDETERLEKYGKLVSFRSELEALEGEGWTWQMRTLDNGKPASRVFAKLEKVSVLNTADWPAIISFFKSRIIALDGFWSLVKDEVRK